MLKSSLHVESKPPGQLARPKSLWQREFPASSLIAFTLAYFTFQNLIFWRFLDFAPAWLYLLGGIASISIGFAAYKIPKHTISSGPTVTSVLVCAAAAFAVCVLGGEGRIFYANVDWQVRDAVLRDLSINTWPFFYESRGQFLILRAPIAMYLLPALAGKVGGLTVAETALLLQNWLLLSVLLALGSTLFREARRPFWALVIVVLFSGMDLAGQYYEHLVNNTKIPEHLEPWFGIQYSSNITQAFWVPNHAFPGWFCAIFFLLWCDRRIQFGIMSSAVVFLTLWSPLPIMGIAPFVAYAGINDLIRKRLNASDVTLAGASILLATPALLYLAASSGDVGMRVVRQDPVGYVVFEALEVLPYLAAALALSRYRLSWFPTVILIALCLFIAPFVQIGQSSDFEMRASIPALTLLSVAVAQYLCSEDAAIREQPLLRRLVILALIVGVATPAFEIYRSIAFLPSPRVQCSLFNAWDRKIGLANTTNATYLAPSQSLPGLIKPQPGAIIHTSNDPATCWPTPWQTPRFNSA